MSSSQTSEHQTELNKKQEENKYNEIKNKGQQYQANQISVFENFQRLIERGSLNQYTVSILNSNIVSLDQYFTKKQRQFSLLQQEVARQKRSNEKIVEAIKAEINRFQKLKTSNKKNQAQLAKTQMKTKKVFEKRLESQLRKNQLYQEFKQLENQYIHKVQDMQKFYSSRTISIRITPRSQNEQNQNVSSNGVLNDMNPQDALSFLKNQNNSQLPSELQEKQQQLEYLQNQLQEKLRTSQIIKQSIKDITENIKSDEQDQYKLQINIEKLQNQRTSLKNKSISVTQRNQYLNELVQNIQTIKQQLDRKLEEKNDLLNYLRQVEKEEKKMRKIRKIQIQCQKQQENYRQEKANQLFTVLDSEQDQYSPQVQDKQVQGQISPSDKRNLSSSPQRNLKQITRLDPKSNEKIISLIQRYEKLKSQRKS